MERVSTGKKALIAGGVVLVGYLVYRHFYGSASAATLTPAPGTPAPGPLPTPPGGGAGSDVGPNASVVVPAAPDASPYPTTTGGPTSYVVSTAQTGAAGQLRVRQLPDVNSQLVATLQHGDTVASNGVSTVNPNPPNTNALGVPYT